MGPSIPGNFCQILRAATEARCWLLAASDGRRGCHPLMYQMRIQMYPNVGYASAPLSTVDPAGFANARCTVGVPKAAVEQVLVMMMISYPGLAGLVTSVSSLDEEISRVYTCHLLVSWSVKFHYSNPKDKGTRCPRMPRDLEISCGQGQQIPIPGDSGGLRLWALPGPPSLPVESPPAVMVKGM